MIARERVVGIRRCAANVGLIDTPISDEEFLAICDLALIGLATMEASIQTMRMESGSGQEKMVGEFRVRIVPVGEGE